MQQQVATWLVKRMLEKHFCHTKSGLSKIKKDVKEQVVTKPECLIVQPKLGGVNSNNQESTPLLIKYWQKI